MPLTRMITAARRPMDPSLEWQLFDYTNGPLDAVDHFLSRPFIDDDAGFVAFLSALNTGNDDALAQRALSVDFLPIAPPPSHQNVLALPIPAPGTCLFPS